MPKTLCTRRIRQGQNTPHRQPRSGPADRRASARAKCASAAQYVQTRAPERARAQLALMVTLCDYMIVFVSGTNGPTRADAHARARPRQLSVTGRQFVHVLCTNPRTRPYARRRTRARARRAPVAVNAGAGSRTRCRRWGLVRHAMPTTGAICQPSGTGYGRFRCTARCLRTSDSGTLGIFAGQGTAK